MTRRGPQNLSVLRSSRVSREVSVIHQSETTPFVETSFHTKKERFVACMQSCGDVSLFVCRLDGEVPCLLL